MKNVKLLLGAFVLSLAMFAGGAVFTQSASAQVLSSQVVALRGDQGSDRNIWNVRRGLERLIDNLQHDQRDYGGHREQALDLMGQARNQLLQAEQFDRQHPGH